MKIKIKNKKKWVIIISISLVLGTLIYFLQNSGIVSQSLNLLLTPYLEKTLKQEVYIGKISSNFFNKIILKDVIVSNPGNFKEGVFLKSKRIVFYYNFWHIFNKKEKSKINRVVIVSPQVFLSKKENKWNIGKITPSAKSSFPFVLLPKEVILKKGKLFIDEEGKYFSFQDVSGKFNLYRDKVITGNVWLKRERDTKEKVKLFGHVDLEKKYFDLKVDIEAIDPAYCTRFVKWDPRVKFLEGKLDLNFFIKGTFPLKKEFLKKMIFDGTINVKKGIVKIDPYPDNLSNINGKLIFNNKKIEVSRLTLDVGDSPFSFSGRIEKPLINPDFNLKLISSDFDFSLFPKLFVQEKYLERIKLEGKGEIDLKVKGSTSNLVFAGEMKGKKSRINGTPVDNLIIDFRYNKNVFNLSNFSFQIGEGEVYADGVLDFNFPSFVENPEFFIYAKNIELNFLSKLLGLGKIKGISNFYLKTKGSLLSPRISGKISLFDLDMKEEKFKTLRAGFKYDNKYLEITGKTDNQRYQIRSRIKLTEEKVKINEFKIVMSNKGKINITGDMSRGNEKQVNLKLTAEKIEGKELPYLKKYFHDIEGEFDFKGRIKGKLRDPFLSGRLFSSNLMIAGNSSTFNAHIQLDKDVLQITSFKLNNYSGVFKMKLNGENTGEAELIADRAKAKMFLSLLNLPDLNINNETELTGAVTLNGSFRDFKKLKIEGKINLSPLADFKKVSLEKLKLDFFMENQILKINNLSLGQKNGQVLLWGAIALYNQSESENNIKLTADFTSFKIGDIRINGSTEYKGNIVYQPTLSMKGNIQSSDLKLNDKKFKTSSCNIVYKQKTINCTAFNLNKEYKGKLKFDFSENPQVKGDVSVNINEISSLFALLPDKFSKLSIPKGQIKAKFFISGLLSSPEIKAYLHIFRGQFRSIGFSFLSNFLYHQGELKLKTTLLKIGREGKVRILGNVFLKDKSGESKETNLIFNLSKIDLKFLKYFLKAEEKIKLTGIADGVLKLKGSLSVPVLSGDIQGEDVSIESFQIKKLDTKFVLADKKITFSQFSVQKKEGEIVFSPGSYLDFSQSDLWRFQVMPVLKNINLSNISFFGGFCGKGSLKFNPVLQVKAELITDNLWVNNHNFEKENLKISFQENCLDFIPINEKDKYVKGRIDFSNKSGIIFNDVKIYKKEEEIFILDGRLDLEKDKTNLLICGLNEGVEAGTIMEILNIRAFNFTGKSRFNLNLTGNFNAPVFSCNLDIEEGSLSGFKFDNFKSSLFVKEEMIIIDELNITRKNERLLTGSGEIPFVFGPKRQEKNKMKKINISLVLQSKEGLSVLSSFSDKIKKIKGEIEGNIKVGGTLLKPEVKGYLLIDNAEIVSKDVMRKIKKFKVDINLIDEQIQIKKVYGEIGKGNINIWGRIYLKEFFKIEKFDLYLETSKERGIPLSLEDIPIPQNRFFDRLFPNLPSSGEAKISARFYGNSQDYHIDGIADLFNTHFTYPPLPTKKIWEDQGYQKSTQWGFLNRAIWNFQINAVENVWYENKFANVNVRGSIKLKDKTKKIKVSGKVEAIKGDINYVGTNFDIKEAILEFKDGVEYLEGKAETHVQRFESQLNGKGQWTDDIITMVFEKGKLGEVKPVFSSKNFPNTNSEEAMKLAITGVDVDNMAPEDREVFLRKEVLRILDATLASPFIKNVLKRTGWVDVIKVTRKEEKVAQETPLISDSQPSIWNGTTITVGKYLSDRFFLGYSMGLYNKFENKLDLQQEIEMSYRLKRSLYIKSVLGLSEEERKVFLEHQWRFGWQEEKEE